MARAKKKSAGRKKAATPRSSPRRATSKHDAKAAALPSLNSEHDDVGAALPSSNADSVFVLPDALDASASLGLRDSLLGRRGTPLIVDASQVRRVGVQSLQVLIAAARTWQAAGQSYEIANPSTELLDAVALIGLPRTELMLEGPTL